MQRRKRLLARMARLQRLRMAEKHAAMRMARESEGAFQRLEQITRRTRELANSYEPIQPAESGAALAGQLRFVAQLTALALQSDGEKHSAEAAARAARQKLAAAEKRSDHACDRHAMLRAEVRNREDHVDAAGNPGLARSVKGFRR